MELNQYYLSPRIMQGNKNITNATINPVYNIINNNIRLPYKYQDLSFKK